MSNGIVRVSPLAHDVFGLLGQFDRNRCVRASALINEINALVTELLNLIDGAGATVRMIYIIECVAVGVVGAVRVGVAQWAVGVYMNYG